MPRINGTTALVAVATLLAGACRELPTSHAAQEADPDAAERAASVEQAALPGASTVCSAYRKRMAELQLGDAAADAELAQQVAAFAALVADACD